MNLLDRWVKPNGSTIELNDEEATVEYARGEGWLLFSETEAGLAEAEAILAERERRAEATVAASKDAKRTRRTKAQMQEAGAQSA